MTTKELRNKIIEEIKGKLSEGYCIDMHILISRDGKPHHPYVYWNRYLTRLYNYKGHLIYDSSGCYTRNLTDIVSLDVLAHINEGIDYGLPVPVSDEVTRKLDEEYMFWGRKEWESQKHEFKYWLWDGKVKTGPFLIRDEMTLAEASDYVKAKYKDTKYQSFELQEFNGLDMTYYYYGI